MAIPPVVAAIAFLLGTVDGHMIMNTPTPFNLQDTAKLLQVDPLGPSFPFPCQGVFDVVAVTPITAGTTQLVNFTGGAQHGGGSCQFSLTYENPPPADKSKWKVIYTIIGGCPVSAEGNLPVTGSDRDGRADAAHCGNDSGTECIRQFDIPIPKDVPNGNATFAWTWFNKIGNREVYMNCAPVTITGGSDNTAFFDELPTLFLANVPGECSTGNGVLNIPTPPVTGSEGSCEKAAGVPTFEDDSGGGFGAVVPPPESVSVTLPDAASSAQPDLGCPAPPAVTSGFVTLTSAPAPVSTSGSGSSSGAQPCSPDGSVTCFGRTSFGICANGLAIPQPVAAATICVNGKIVRRRTKLFF
ncbi:hypothetical protein MMYC01_200458 [Madurella mycetomatis]|uniref:Lytic polysaccharide monooxygenase n=1 Tax=Madurella mycetomatis TaxID=100816 RepID=A0A175VTF3_9PEZI|nr:hypothetical protein MMYC01_208606 [Madurella mycetomatis]KXX83021.1 hypothetical protein MMYC01_200458 [Madurella mycetomatis]